MVGKVLVAALITLGLLQAVTVFAAEESVVEETESTEGDQSVFAKPIYVPIKPAFVVNYGGEGKLQYLKIEVSLRMENVSASNAARHHMPLLRDYLVSLFSRQTNADIDTPDGKEALRQRALKGVQDVLVAEEGEQGVINLFFSHFIVQK